MPRHHRGEHPLQQEAVPRVVASPQQQQQQQAVSPVVTSPQQQQRQQQQQRLQHPGDTERSDRLQMLQPVPPLGWPLTCCPCGVGPGGAPGARLEGHTISACACSCLVVHLPQWSSLVRVTSIKTYYMGYGFFGDNTQGNLGGQLVNLCSQCHFHFDYCDRWDRHIYICRPGAFQAGAAGHAGAEAGADLEIFAGDPGNFAENFTEATMHLSCLHPVKNLAPPLGGAGHTDGQFKWLTRKAPEHKTDREIWSETVSQNGYALRHAAPALKVDRESGVKTVSQNGYAHKHAAPEVERGYFFSTRGTRPLPGLPAPPGVPSQHSGG